MRRSTCVDFNDALWAVTVSPAEENTLSDDTLTALDISISGNRIVISYQCSFESQYEYVSIKSCSSNSQSQNNRKIHINFAKHTFKSCGRKLYQLPPLPIFRQKRLVTLLAIVKTNVYNELSSELVGNELMSQCIVFLPCSTFAIKKISPKRSLVLYTSTDF
jgi:hypothetical protein